ncbi:hypothetical protein FRX31_016349 [Thalictrum thalictroides]|uniref:Ubiquitin-like protease family profile domain-containing protein n=1 Tax=Thalictrum thalictroides TaxID=46969 RepID=A0A7J6W9E1_THATH|nr:hypothetical protein FRX31_016349 [Thalictrum thalictroides]
MVEDLMFDNFTTSEKNEVVNCIDQADCGFYVCRIIEALSFGEKLPTCKDFQSNVEELKPTLTGQILGDKKQSSDLDKEYNERQVSRHFKIE